MLMKFSRSSQLREALSLGISVSIHALLLLGAYYWVPMEPGAVVPATSYRIQLSKSAPAPSPSVPEEKQAQAPQKRSKKNSAKAAPKKKPHTDIIAAKAIMGESKVLDTENSEKKEERTRDIDQRSLYTNSPNQSVGAVLEIVGWTWDTVPQPKDDTEESGRIVFEITIDDLGEVVSVKTLEKTVSPVVEQIYKDSLTVLTFSKLTGNTSKEQTFTGKVTFIIQAR